MADVIGVGEADSVPPGCAGEMLNGGMTALKSFSQTVVVPWNELIRLGAGRPSICSRPIRSRVTAVGLGSPTFIHTRKAMLPYVPPTDCGCTARKSVWVIPSMNRSVVGWTAAINWTLRMTTNAPDRFTL